MAELLEFVQGNGGAYLFLVFIILLFGSAKQVYEGILWCLDKLNIYHKAMSEKEEKEKETENRLGRLETIAEKDFKALETLDGKMNDAETHIKKIDEILEKNCDVLSKINDDIKLISDTLSDNKQADDEFALAMCRNTMDRLYKEAMQQGYVTKAEFEAFESLKEIYLSRNGNAYYKHHVIPGFEKMPVRENAAYEE